MDYTYIILLILVWLSIGARMSFAYIKDTYWNGFFNQSPREKTLAALVCMSLTILGPFAVSIYVAFL